MRKEPNIERIWNASAFSEIEGENDAPFLPVRLKR